MVTRGPFQFDDLKSDSLLVVEGIDDARFLNAFLKYIGIGYVQIAVAGGRDSFGAFLSGTLPRTRHVSRLRRLALVRDADLDAQAAFQSLCGLLSQAGWPAPPSPWTRHESGDLSVAVAIVPDGDGPGDLEELCLRSIADDEPVLNCVNQYLNCLHSSGAHMGHQSKTKLYAFLAAGENPGRRLGEAADAGVWDWDSPALQPLADFLRQL